MLSGLAALACVAGIVSVGLLLRQAAPRRVHDRKRPELRALARAALDPRIRPWLRYLLCWNAAVALSASFFSYHMLSYLGLGFAVVALHGVAVAVVRVATAPLWGHAVDRLGARPVLVLCSFGIAAVPALWLVIAPDFLWPLAVEAAAAGALWAGHGIAAMDLTLNSAPADRRPYYVAVFGATSGLGFGIASVLAGLVAASLPRALGRLWHVVDGDPPPLPGLGRGAGTGRLHRPAHRGARRPLPRRRGANDCRPRPRLAEAASPARLNKAVAGANHYERTARSPHVSGAAAAQRSAISRNP